MARKPARTQHLQKPRPSTGVHALAESGHRGVERRRVRSEGVRQRAAQELNRRHILGRRIVASIEGEYRRYKQLGENALDQLTDEQLCLTVNPEGNSIATLMWHISGNLASRFTDFLTSDGEKPWRDRESEFLTRTVDRMKLREKWESSWATLLRSLGDLDDRQLHTVVTIRGLPLSVHEALHRSLAHTSYHVGQIVLLAKAFRGANWRYLSIPPGQSEQYNKNPVAEKPPGP